MKLKLLKRCALSHFKYQMRDNIIVQDAVVLRLGELFAQLQVKQMMSNHVLDLTS